MLRRVFFRLAVFTVIQVGLGIALPSLSLAQEREVRVKPRGILKVVDLGIPSISVMLNYAEGLVTLDKDNNWVPGLAEEWRWIDDRTIEFKLRQGVRFHNGERLNAEAVRVNWEAYRKMKNPRAIEFDVIPHGTAFEIIDEYAVRFTFPEPNGLAFVRGLWCFRLFAPAFFLGHRFDEYNWACLREAGPWATGPFRLVEGSLSMFSASDRIVLEAYEGYWDRRYPKVQKVILNNTLIGNRKEAMRLCRETEGAVDIVSHIRPLDTLKVAESPFAKVVKSKDITWLRGIFNHRKRGSKWKDIRLRRALNYAVNRKELWRYAAKGNAYNLGGVIPPGAYGHNPNLTLYPYDTTKARSLLAQAGYPNGFEVKIIALEALELETQIIGRMLERIGLKVSFEILTETEFWRKVCISLLDKPPEQQDWDIHLGTVYDYFGHPGASFLPWNFIEDSDMRWIEYDPVYEKMWKDMARTVDPEVQEGKIRQMVQYLYDNAHAIFIYSPISLYAVNKEVNFVPYRGYYLRFKETSVTDNHWSVRGEKK